MSETELKLSSKDFAITPGGEVVIDNKKLTEILEKAKKPETHATHRAETEVSVSVTVKI